MAYGAVAPWGRLKTRPAALKKCGHLWPVDGFPFNAAAIAATALMGCTASNTLKNTRITHETVTRARAALATPPPEPPAQSDFKYQCFIEDYK